MRNWVEKQKLAVFFALSILVSFQADCVCSASGTTFEITAIESNLNENVLEYNIQGGAKPVYTVTERFSPFRVVLDVANAEFANQTVRDMVNIPSSSFVQLELEELAAQSPPIKRFTFTLSDTHNYDIAPSANGIRLTFNPASSSPAQSQAAAPAIIRELKVGKTPNSTTISIVSSAPISDYNIDTLKQNSGNPPRMFIDIPGIGMNGSGSETNIGTSVARARVASTDKGVRIIFDSATEELFKYMVTRTRQGLDVIVDESSATSARTAGGGKKRSLEDDKTLDALITSSEELLKQDPDEIQSRAQKKLNMLEDDFSFSGYKKTRISVDFYKIDIHNVFRLFREITDLNIIIDEDVKGSLTLALNDVPWDFALDIVLNLMNLKKEEKFNTIVIYPADKEFVWPTRAEDNLAFEADVDLIEQEALVIEKANNASKEVMEAKKLIASAKTEEKHGNFELATELYIQATALWPDNTRILNRLASIYLVNLGMNAKAVYFAEKSLKIDDNPQAALYAAIGSANMQRYIEAKEFFSQSISASPPSKEALLSYAAFSENIEENGAALKLVDKYEEYYGETLDTMLAKARLFDKAGNKAAADDQYRALLTSGFPVKLDLKQFIEARLSSYN